MRSSNKQLKITKCSALRIWLNRKFNQIRRSLSNRVGCETTPDRSSLSSGAERNLSSGTRSVKETSFRDAATQTVEITMSDCATQVDETMFTCSVSQDDVSQASGQCLDSLSWHSEYAEEAHKVCLALEMHALENTPFSTGFQRSFRSRIPVLARTTSSRGGLGAPKLPTTLCLTALRCKDVQKIGTITH